MARPKAPGGSRGNHFGGVSALAVGLPCKAFGIAFLALPRSVGAAQAIEAPGALRLGLVALACVGLGLAPGSVVRLLGAVTTPLVDGVAPGGDVEARLRVRLDEARESWRLVQELLDTAPDGAIRTEVTPPGRRAVGLGATESPRGAEVHWLLLDPAGRIERLRVRSASFANWPLVAAAAPGNLVPDFPLINKSFELCYACCNR